LDGTWFIHHNTPTHTILSIHNLKKKTQLQWFHSHPIVLTLFNRLIPVPKTTAANPYFFILINEMLESMGTSLQSKDTIRFNIIYLVVLH
jgi:hypothetical protein